MYELILVGLFLIYTGYREWMHYQQVKDLELKAFTKTPQEYATYKNVEKVAKPMPKEEEDNLADPFEVDPNDALKGIVK